VKIAILGCGKMGQALGKGIYSRFDQWEFFTYTPTLTRACELAKSIKGTAYSSIEKLPDLEIIIIACKPQQFSQLAVELKIRLSKMETQPLIVSVMAGISVDLINKSLATNKVVRAMPNTPCLVGEGITGLFYPDYIVKEERNLISSLFESVSYVVTVKNEDWIDRITAFIGSGPAYIFELADIMVEKLIRDKMPKEESLEIIKHLFYGAGCLMEKSLLSPGELRDQVTSKGGTTAAALEIFRRKGLQSIMTEAIEQAYIRAKEISCEFNKNLNEE
jgi:pyrroline-5-carboxylate reductase